MTFFRAQHILDQNKKRKKDAKTRKAQRERFDKITEELSPKRGHSYGVGQKRMIPLFLVQLFAGLLFEDDNSGDEMEDDDEEFD